MIVAYPPSKSFRIWSIYLIVFASSCLMGLNVNFLFTPEFCINLSNCSLLIFFFLSFILVAKSLSINFKKDKLLIPQLC